MCLLLIPSLLNVLITMKHFFSQTDLRTSILTESSGGGTGRIVQPGNTETYEFTVPWSVAPGEEDPDCLPYLYYSDYEMERDVSSGLIGPVLICRPGALDRNTGKQVRKCMLFSSRSKTCT